MRPALARLHGALIRAWQLGMLVPTSAADEQLLRDALTLDVGELPGGPREFAPLSDAEYLAVFDRLFLRFRALADAYGRAQNSSRQVNSGR